MATDEDGRVGSGRDLGQLEDPLHGGALRDEVAEPVLLLQGQAQDGVLAHQALLRDHLLHEERELLRVEGLHQVVEGAELHGRDRGVHRGVGGHHDHGRLRLELARLLQDLEPVHAGHLEVHQHDVPALALHLLDGAAPVGSGGDLEAVLLQPPAQGFPDDLLVVDHQDPGVLSSH